MRHDHCAFDDTLVLADLAQRIVTDGAQSVLHCKLSDRETREWENAARRYIDWQGDDDGDFAGMAEDFYNPAIDQGWALDVDFLRDERVTWGMAA